MIGGENLKGVVHGILERVIGPILNTQLNYTGKFRKVKLRDTNACKLIIGTQLVRLFNDTLVICIDKCSSMMLNLSLNISEAVRNSDFSIGQTDHAIIDLVKKWLYGCGDRDGGRDKRRKASNIGQNSSLANLTEDT